MKKRKPIRLQVPPSSDELLQEGSLATERLTGKVVNNVKRFRSSEIQVEFTDGTRLFVDATADGVELSITGGAGE